MNLARTIILIMLILVPIIGFSALDNIVHVRGNIHQKFNKNFVQIRDEYNQIIEVPRKYIPKDVKVRTGQLVVFRIAQSKIRYSNSYIHIRMKKSK